MEHRRRGGRSRVFISIIILVAIYYLDASICAWYCSVDLFCSFQEKICRKLKISMN